MIEGYMVGGTVGYPEWKCEGIRVENPDGNFVITESKSEGIKGGALLGLKDNIIDGGVLWVTVGSPQWKFDGIRVEKPDGKSKGFSFGTAEGETLGLIDNTMLGVADSSKLEK